MKRRSSALSVSVAALLAAVAPALTGCSTEAHPGAAAVVGGEQISLAAVQADVEAVRDAQRAHPDADQLIAASGGLTRERVEFLVYLGVLERTAQDAGVEVSRRDVRAARAEAELSLGGAEALAQAALMPQQNATPLAGDEQIEQMLRSQLLFQRLAERLGVTPDPQGFAVLTAALSETAEEIGVEVNPRYGRWDPEQVMLADPSAPWLRTAPDESGGGVTLDG